MHSDVSGLQERPVVVGVDRARNRSAAVDLAAKEAVRRHAPLLIVHVWTGPDTGIYRGSGALSSAADAGRVLRNSARRVQAARPELRARTEVLHGDAATMLNQQAEHANLLVVGHRDDATLWCGCGATTARLVRSTACPLLVYRGVQPARGPVVVATSARPGGTATLEYAFTQARMLGTRLVAVHMWMRPGGSENPAPAVVVGGYAVEREAARHALAASLAAVAERFPDVPVDPLLVNDRDLAPTMERASRRARLLVAGIGRSGRFAELLGGPVGPNAARRTSCPVFLVPPSWQPSETVSSGWRQPLTAK